MCVRVRVWQSHAGGLEQRRRRARGVERASCMVMCMAGVGFSPSMMLQDVSESVSSRSSNGEPREVTAARLSPCVFSCALVAGKRLLIPLARSPSRLAESGPVPGSRRSRGLEKGLAKKMPRAQIST